MNVRKEQSLLKNLISGGCRRGFFYSAQYIHTYLHGGHTGLHFGQICSVGYIIRPIKNAILYKNELPYGCYKDILIAHSHKPHVSTLFKFCAIRISFLLIF